VIEILLIRQGGRRRCGGLGEAGVLSSSGVDQLSSRRSTVEKAIGKAGGQAKIVLDL
jgi:hypothetical protein